MAGRQSQDLSFSSGTGFYVVYKAIAQAIPVNLAGYFSQMISLWLVGAPLPS